MNYALQIQHEGGRYKLRWLAPSPALCLCVCERVRERKEETENESKVCNLGFVHYELVDIWFQCLDRASHANERLVFSIWSRPYFTHCHAIYFVSIPHIDSALCRTIDSVIG